MRRIARIAGAVLLACAAVAVTATPASAAGSVNLKVSAEGRAPIVGGEPGAEGRTIGYWGKLSTLSGAPAARYRATCSWLAAHDGWNHDPNKRDNRILCTIVLSFRATGGAAAVGTTVVAQGLMLRPEGKKGLFTRAWERRLPITGATGDYHRAEGEIYAKPNDEIRVEIYA
jgi:hypothetical protein